MIRYALDLELEQPSSNPQTPDSLLTEAKIIQIGAVFFNQCTQETLFYKDWKINIGVPLSAFIKKLTGITDQQISEGTTIDIAYKDLLDLVVSYEVVRRPIVWGSGDLTALQNEAKSYKLGRGESNVKALWQDLAPMLGINGRGGLSKACSKAGIGFIGKSHDAVVDSFNTMRMFLHIMDMIKK